MIKKRCRSHGVKNVSLHTHVTLGEGRTEMH